MDQIDQREWLLTDGSGSFACGTVAEARTRTYHGWLIAALNPPGDRQLLFSHLEASLEVEGQNWALGTNFWGGGTVAPLGYLLLKSFRRVPCPRWIWGEGNWQLTRRLMMPHGGLKPKGKSRILIEYGYEGQVAAVLRLRVLAGDRNFHHQQQANPSLHFAQQQHQQCLTIQAVREQQPQTLWQLRWSRGEYQADGVWYWNYDYPQERARGLAAREDLYSPGYLTVTLQPGEKIILEAGVGTLPTTPLAVTDFDQAVQQEEQRLQSLFPEYAQVAVDDPLTLLLQASDQFIVYRTSTDSLTAIAGYPWFDDWGRDTLIALPGLTLTTQRFEVAKGFLQTFSRYCCEGLIPNTFPDGGATPIYNSLDAALWWVEGLGLYLNATQDWHFLQEQYATVRQIYKAFTVGTRYRICIDAVDGLLTWDATGVALTWMDAVIESQVITPRRGKPVEINALWYSMLCWMQQWALRLGKDDQSGRYAQQAEKVKKSLQKFWNPLQGYLYDAIAPNDEVDATIRPNAVLALSLQHCAFPTTQGQQVLQIATERLLTPYGLRSLDPSDRDYQGYYNGSREHRDRAYHQGTVWSWLLGPFLAAWKRFYPGVQPPFNWQPILTHLSDQGCLGSISEIFDGESPHNPQGTFAQAWSVAEILRYFPDFRGS